jgi:hypothetical protein
MAAAKPREGYAHRVLVRDGPRVHVIPVDKIDYVQAQDDYVCFRSEGKDYLKEQTLAEVETSLDPAAFVRIHRSYLLNLARLVRVDQDERENRVAVLTDGRRCQSAAPATHGSTRCSNELSPRATASMRVVEDDPDRVPHTGADAAHTVAEIHAVVALSRPAQAGDGRRRPPHRPAEAGRPQRGSACAAAVRSAQTRRL